MTVINNLSLRYIRSIALKWGLISTASMILYFFFMHELDMVNHIGWRFINYAILFAAMYMALMEVRRRYVNHQVNYLAGMGLLLMLSVVNSTSFGIFMVIYCAIDINFIPMISPLLPHWGKLTPVMVGFQISSEIFLISVILVLTVLMLFKRNTFTGKRLLHKKKGQISAG